MIISVIHTTLTVVKLKPEKNSGLNEIQTHDLCNTGVVLYESRPEFFQALISQLLKLCV